MCTSALIAIAILGKVTAASYSSESNDFASAVAEDKIYMVPSGLRALFICDATIRNWILGTSYTTNFNVSAAATITANSKSPELIYFLGPNSTNAYNPLIDRWQTETPMPIGIVDFGVAVLNDTLFVVGGYSCSIQENYDSLGLNAQYTPLAFSPSPTSTQPSPTPSPNQAPILSIVSPLNNTFFNVSIEGIDFQLTYETNSAISWVGYSIDGGSNVTASINSTHVHDIESSGYHTLTVYANDTSGEWAATQIVTYLVNVYPDLAIAPTQQPKLEPSLTTSPTPNEEKSNPNLALVTTIIIVTATAVAGLLAYFRKRRE